ncbi:MAG: O-antigen ligase family protein [Anaerolineae bacterium]|nr:O-antigen ligase family protein [Anaerolineae bacterium]
MMNKTWLLLLVCIALAAGSGVGALVTLDQRAFETRGWENATGTLDVPSRLPLAGVNVDLLQYTPDDLTVELDHIAAAGFTWVRQSFLWQNIEPEPGRFEWAAYDALVGAVAEHDSLQLVAVLDGTPAWARDSFAPEHPFAPPVSVGEYARFAGTLADRYADTITYYQIWDEPNIKTHWGNLDPEPAHYVAMLRGAYDAIHNADPDASVIVAALAPTVETGPENLSDLLFLRAIYDLGGQGYFDAAAGKPYGFEFSPTDRRVDADLLNFSRLILLREEMMRRGDGTKPLWGSNFGWNHLPGDWIGPPSIWGSASAAQQETYTREAYARAAREWPWVGGLIVQHWDPDAPPDDPVQGFALAPRIDEWLVNGPLVDETALIPGLHPPQNPFTVYSENWRFRDYGADAIIPPGADLTSIENRITVQFQGTEFALPVRRGDYLAYLHVTVDGDPANALPRNRQGETAILLTSPDRQPETSLITIARDLPDGIHTVEIVYRPTEGDARWPVAGYAVAAPPDTGRYDRALILCGVIGALSLLGAAITAIRAPWRNFKAPSAPTIRQMVEWALSLVASLLVLFGALITWSETIPSLLRRDPPALVVTILTAGLASLSPVALFTLVVLVFMFVLIYNRPLLGVMLVIFWSAFFQSTLDLLVGLFATVEVYFGLTVAALIARALVGWAKTRQDSDASPPQHAPIRLLPLDWLVLAFAILGIVSLSWVEFWPQAVRDLRVVILEPAAFYFLVRLMRLERRDLVWLVDTLLFTGGTIAVVGLVRFVTGESVVEVEEGGRRLMSVYGSPNGVGLYLGRCLPFALAYVLLLPRGSWRWAYGAVSGAVMLLAVLLSQSRGAIMLGLPTALIGVLVWWRGRRAVRPVLLALVATAAMIVVLSFVLPRLSDPGGDTAIFRRHLWYSSVNLIRERPLTGAGPDQFLYWYRSRYLLPEAWEEPNLSIPHTIVLNHWVNLGILGVLALASFQGVFWSMLWRARRRVTGSDPLLLALVLGAAGSMIDLLVHGLVDVGYFGINLAFVFFLLMVLAQRLSSLIGALAQTTE